MEDRDSDRLVARAQGGDSDAVRDLYLRYFDRVYDYVRLLVRDRHDAQDVTQDIFLELMHLLPRYQLRLGQPFRLLVYRVARQRGIDHFRKHSRVEPEAPADMASRVGSGRVNSEELEATRDALRWVTDAELKLLMDRLPMSQRQVLLLHYGHDFNGMEIAAILDRTPQAVRNLEHRALTSMRERLESVGRKATGSSRRSPSLVRLRGGRVLLERRFALAGSLGRAGPAGRARRW